MLNRDNPHYARLAAAARARGIVRILGFGAHADAAVRLIDCHLHATASAVTASVMGEIVDYCVAMPGRHWVMNSLAVLAAVKAAGGDVGAAAAALGAMRAAGRARPAPQDRGRAAARAELIDESYNASPASMRAALAVLARERARQGRAAHRRAGRHAASSGTDSRATPRRARRSRSSRPASISCSPSATTCARSATRCRSSCAAPTRATAAEMAALLRRGSRAGDIVTVKGSYGSRMRDVVARLLRRAGRRRGQGLAAMLFHLLAPLADRFEPFNLFRY